MLGPVIALQGKLGNPISGGDCVLLRGRILGRKSSASGKEQKGNRRGSLAILHEKIMLGKNTHDARKIAKGGGMWGRGSFQCGEGGGPVSIQLIAGNNTCARKSGLRKEKMVTKYLRKEKSSKEKKRRKGCEPSV